MARGFWRGVLAGSLIGGLMGAWFAPSLKPDFREKVMTRSRDLRRRAERLARRTKAEVEDALDER